MKRRELLKRGAALLGASLWGGSIPRAMPSRPVGTTADEGQIMTVTGPVAPEDLGTTLPHEHVLSRFGEPPARRPDYDLATVFDTVVPILARVSELGCDAIMDCTAAYFGRDPLTLRRLTHRESGLTLAVHTSGNVAAAQEQLRILREEGVSPMAWIWVHAQNVDDLDALSDAAEQGAWIEFDAIRPDTIAQHVKLVQAMKERGHLGRVLLSHDGSSFPPEGTVPRPYDLLFTTFIPALREVGFSDDEVRRLTVENPRQAFTVRVRT